MKTIAYSLLIITAGSLVACSQQQETIGTPVQQVSVARIDSMPDMPQPYKMLDWRKRPKTSTVTPSTSTPKSMAILSLVR